MARLVTGLVMVLAVLLQTSVAPVLLPVQVWPNLVLVLVLVISARVGAVEGLIWALFGGLLLDVLALDALGVNMLALTPVVLLGGLSRRRLFHSGILVPMVLAVVATMLYAVVLDLARALSGQALAPIGPVLRLTFLQALLNALLVPPAWLLLGRVFQHENERVTR